MKTSKPDQRSPSRETAALLPGLCEVLPGVASIPPGRHLEVPWIGFV